MKFASLPLFIIAGVWVCPAGAQAQLATGSGSAGTAASSSGPASAAVASSSRELHLGPFTLKPSISDRLIYSDGLLLTPGRPTNTYINTVSPVLALTLGSDLSLTYRPTWTEYTNGAFTDTFGQSVLFGATSLHERWSLQFNQSYASSKTPRTETARQTAQEDVSTNLNVSIRFSDRWSLNTGIAQSLSFISASPDNYTWSANSALSYHPSEKIALSLSGAAGLTDFDPGANMSYVRPGASINWQPTSKLSVGLNTGWDRRRFDKTGSPVTWTPTTGGSLTYSPFEQTSLTYSASRTLSPGYSKDSLTDQQSWNAGLQQRLLRHFDLAVSYASAKSNYTGTLIVFEPQLGTVDILDGSGNVIATLAQVSFVPREVADIRNDKTRTFTASLRTTLRQKFSVGISYQRSRNASDATGYGFQTRQFGGDVSYRF